MTVNASFRAITTDMPIIGFTGALGSGCTNLSKGLADYHGYAYCSLSDRVYQELKRRKLPKTIGNLQDVGNDLRRKHGPDVLVQYALSEADTKIPALGEAERPVGLVVDGIRNSAEIASLRHWPHFFLLSIHAAPDVRRKRLVGAKRCKSKAEFQKIDSRDAEEKGPFGQQVTRCNYLADIVVINDENVPPQAAKKHREYVSSHVYHRYVVNIEQLARNEPRFEARPTLAERLMTMAYVESRRSSCLKRKVGAVISDRDHQVITAAHNDVPDGSPPCLEDERYNWCARDVLQERLASEIEHCPRCGRKITIDVRCPHCKKKIKEFRKRCPACEKEIELEYSCPDCETKVFEEFLPGKNPERSGKLLDMCRALHAEERAILNLSRAGTRVPDEAILFSTTFPCNLCANKIVSAGIKRVVYAEPYITVEAEKILRERGVKLDRFEGVKSSAYFRLYS